MAPSDSVLKLSFPDRNDKVRICMSVEERSVCETECIRVPEFPNCFIETGWVEPICDIEDVSSSDPVQVYIGSDRLLPPLLLLEDVMYVVEYDNKRIDPVFGYLKKNSDKASLNKHSLSVGNYYNLHFHSYVGKGYLDVNIKENDAEENDAVEGSVKVQFEVRSRKIGYLKEYPRMLSDIAEFSTALLMTPKSPLYTCYEFSDHRRDTSYEDFMILDYIFSKLDFKGTYWYVRGNRHSELISRIETVPAGFASDIDTADLTNLLCKDNLIPMKGGPIAGVYAPREVSESIWEDSYDTPENRLVKELVLTMDRMVSNLISKDAVSKSEYVKTRLSDMSKDLNEMVNDRWLTVIGDMGVLPYDSSVLRSRYGYADLFQMYLVLGLGVMFKQGDAEDLLNGQNKKLHKVYEYWCYTRLFKCLYEMAEEVPKFPLKFDDEEWTLTIASSS